MTTHAAQRKHMIERDLRGRGIHQARVLEAFAAVPREEFVDDPDRAYADMALPISHGQTISQPYVVALTVHALMLEGHERVLEIGAGTGYAAAILGRLAREVHTIERIPALCETAAARLRRLGITNVHVHCADGTLGWPVAAPYEGIAVAAGAPHPPRALLEQLAISGRLVVPAGTQDDQRLLRITRRDAGDFSEENLGGVRFVPLIGEQGWPVPS